MTATCQIFRGDFYATDSATTAVKESTYYRQLARGEMLRGNPVISMMLRQEMRFHALSAVRRARLYRASRQ